MEAFLDELQERAQEKGGPLVVRLPRASGMREQRWAHLLCGPVDTAQAAMHSAGGAGEGALQARIEALENEVSQLRATVENMAQELGMSPPGHD